MCWDTRFKVSLMERERDVSSTFRELRAIEERLRAMALLIRAFLETAANPAFRHHLQNEILFRYHVLEDRSLDNPGFTPFYDRSFFETISHYKKNTELNIATISARQWYLLLLEDKLLNEAATDSSPAKLIPVRCEALNPDADWPLTWALMRSRGLPSSVTSFMYKLVHLLLPTQERILRLGVDKQGDQGRFAMRSDQSLQAFS